MIGQRELKTDGDPGAPFDALLQADCCVPPSSPGRQSPARRGHLLIHAALNIRLLHIHPAVTSSSSALTHAARRRSCFAGNAVPSALGSRMVPRSTSDRIPHSRMLRRPQRLDGSWIIFSRLEKRRRRTSLWELGAMFMIVLGEQRRPEVAGNDSAAPTGSDSGPA